MALPLSFIVVLLVAALTAIGIGFRQRWLALSAPSVLFGGLSYFFISMYMARLRGEGQFYSFPSGGYAVSDQAILYSMVFWTALWALVLHLVLPRWDRETRAKGPGRVNWGAVAIRTLLAIGPLGFTPVLGWLLADGYLNLGGGCKDIIMVFPWMGWSLVYFIVFVVYTVKKSPLGRSVWRSALFATGISAAIFAVFFVFSLAGVA